MVFDASGKDLGCLETMLARAKQERKTTSSPSSSLTCELTNWMKRAVGDTQHAAGSCRMGPVGSPTTVVDSECRVLGVENLHVADASIMPWVVRANTHLTCVMLAEKVACLLAQSKRGEKKQTLENCKESDRFIVNKRQE